MPVEIHIEPQFDALRRQMRRYPTHVVERATIRSLNRIGAQARTLAVRTMSREYRIPQKYFRSRITLNKATKTQHRVIVGFPMSRGSKAEARAGSLLVTASGLLSHLQPAARLNRAETLPLIGEAASRPFLQSPRGYNQLFRRVTTARYPLSVARVDLAPSWRAIQSQLRAQSSRNFPKEWDRNAKYLLSRIRR